MTLLQLAVGSEAFSGDIRVEQNFLRPVVQLLDWLFLVLHEQVVAALAGHWLGQHDLLFVAEGPTVAEHFAFINVHEWKVPPLYQHTLLYFHFTPASFYHLLPFLHSWVVTRALMNGSLAFVVLRLKLGRWLEFFVAVDLVALCFVSVINVIIGVEVGLVERNGVGDYARVVQVVVDGDVRGLRLELRRVERLRHCLGLRGPLFPLSFVRRVDWAQDTHEIRIQIPLVPRSELNVVCSHWPPLGAALSRIVWRFLPFFGNLRFVSDGSRPHQASASHRWLFF